MSFDLAILGLLFGILSGQAEQSDRRRFMLAFDLLSIAFGVAFILSVLADIFGGRP